MTAPKITRMQRGLEIERRVRDCITAMGQGDDANGRERFIDHALWCAKKQEMRLFKDASKPMREMAHLSLTTLLNERRPPKNSVPGYRSMNEHWVLDIWEVACDDYFRVKPADRIEPAIEVLVSTKNGAVPITPLSTRILEAYLAKDADLMLSCLGELEAKGL